MNGTLLTFHPMKNLITNPLTRAAIAGAAVWLASVFMAHGQNKTDDLKQRIVAQAKSVGADDYAFTRTIRYEPTADGKTETRIHVEKYDPTKSGDARWILVSVNGVPPSAYSLSEFRKDTPKRRVPGYYRLASCFAGPGTTKTDSRGRTVFGFASLPKDSLLLFDNDVSRDSSLEASVGEANGVPFVERVWVSIKPMRIKLIMKLDHYESISRFRMGPDSKPLLVDQIVDMTMSGLGQEGSVHQVITYSDYRAVK
jgi:hypothetical protein